MKINKYSFFIKNQSKIFLFIFFVFLLLSVNNYLISQTSAIKVKISFDKNIEAKYYEVLWLTTDKDYETARKFPRGSYIQKAVSSPFKAKIDSNIRFFKIRSVYSKDVYGAWSKLYKIDKSSLAKTSVEPILKTEEILTLPPDLRGLFKILSVSGQKKLFFIGEKLPLDSLAEKDTFYYSLTNNKRILYEKALNPEASGEYTILFFLNADDKVPFKKFVFWIDKKAPLTFLGLYPPFYSSRNVLFLCKDSYIELRAAEPYSGIKDIYYRIYAVGDRLPAFMPALDKMFVKDLTAPIEKDFMLEYYAEDQMNNKANIGAAYFFIDTLPPRIRNYSLKFGKITFLQIDDVSTPIQLKIYSENKLYFQKHIFDSTDLIKGKDIPEQGKITFELIDMLKNKTVEERNIP
ncbi:MAG: hypothetical protein OEZ13_11825 [Spirochaetia bacterium]|nr:hypothetical protein [Spirochaetia bacterium]